MLVTWFVAIARGRSAIVCVFQIRTSSLAFTTVFSFAGITSLVPMLSRTMLSFGALGIRAGLCVQTTSFLSLLLRLGGVRAVFLGGWLTSVNGILIPCFEVELILRLVSIISWS
jgi:hypothetical protein